MSYQWFKDGQALAGKTSASLTLSNVQVSEAGDYTVKVSNSVGEATSAVAKVAITVAPTIKTLPQDLTVAQGGEATFTVVVEGTAPFNYQWLLNGAPITGATSDTLVVPSVQPSNAGSYSVRVSNPAGSVTSAAATLTVIVPPTITTQPQSQTIVAGSSVTFSVVVTGTEPLSYQWFRAGQVLEGKTSASLVIPTVQVSDAGDYTVKVGNTGGEVTSNPAKLVVLVPPTIKTPPGSQTVVAGKDVTFTVAVEDGAVHHEWLLSGTPIPGQAGESLLPACSRPTPSIARG